MLETLGLMEPDERSYFELFLFEFDDERFDGLSVKLEVGLRFGLLIVRENRPPAESPSFVCVRKSQLQNSFY